MEDEGWTSTKLTQAVHRVVHGDAALQMPQEAQVRIANAKVIALEEELKDAHAEIDERDRKLLSVEKELRDLLVEKASWQKAQKVAETLREKSQRQVEELQRKLEASDIKGQDMKRELERLQRTNQKTDSEAKAREVRLNRALEEVDKYKKVLEQTRSTVRESEVVPKKDHDRLLQDRKQLEKQKAELVAAFRKQVKLIDILKKQQIHMEAARLLSFTEDEFMKTLESGLSV